MERALIFGGLLLAANVCDAKPLLKREFPHTNTRGDQLANEFQILNPHLITKAPNHHKASDGSYSLSPSPLMINNDDIVTVKFSSSDPDGGDWVGAYSPSDVDPTATVPVKYGWCDDDSDYMDGGSGQLTFNMTNLRADIKFYYFKNSTANPVLVDSTAPIVDFYNYNQPLRPRVIPTGDPDVFSLLWSSASSTAPVMKWGTEPGIYPNVVDASTDIIDQSEMCGAPANSTGWRELGLIHRSDFSGMLELSSQQLYYIFGDEPTLDFSDEFVFFVPPAKGQQPPADKNRGTRVILFDDLGRGSNDDSFTWYEYGRPSIYTAEAVGAEVLAGTVDAIYHGGDISYATGYEAVWDFFLDMAVPMTSHCVYLTTVGNHESDWTDSASLYNNTDSGGECGVPATRLIPMPTPATTNKPWWSYDVGLIHMIGMSSEHDYSIGSEQYLWLQADLEAIDRTVTPWVIFGSHRAMYLNSDYGGSVTSDLVVMQNLITNIEPLLWQYRVNLGFYGHNHVVQRHSAVLNYTVIQAAEKTFDDEQHEVWVHEDPQATVHFVIGTGGATFTKNYVTPFPEWNEMVMYEYGYARVEAVNSTYLHWEWVNSQTLEVRDRVVMTQVDPTKAWVV